MNYNLSKSLVSAFDKTEGRYGEMECGLKFYHQYILKDIPFIESDAMRKGIYYEFLVTGQKPLNGKEPLPDRTKKGELTADYQRIYDNAKHIIASAIITTNCGHT